MLLFSGYATYLTVRFYSFMFRVFEAELTFFFHKVDKFFPELTEDRGIDLGSSSLQAPDHL